MKKTLIATAIALTVSTAALGEGIHSGSKSGAYFNTVCPQVKDSLSKAYFQHQCETSLGTLDNQAKVTASPGDVGIGQWDVMAQLPAEQLDALEIVDPKIGLECIYAVTSETGLTSLADLHERIPMALPSEKSGSTATFKFMQTLDPDGLGSASDAIQSVIDGDAKIAFFVQMPDTGNAVFKQINKAKLSFIPVINRTILKQEIAGIRLYEAGQVAVTPQGLLASLTKKPVPVIDTTCTKIVAFTGKATEGNVDQHDLIKQLGAIEPPKADSKLGSMLGNFKTLATDQIAKYTQ